MAARLLYGLGNVLIYRPLSDVLGFSNVRIAYSIGEASDPGLIRFFRSLGLNLKTTRLSDAVPQEREMAA